jgi:hypothetical protein
MAINAMRGPILVLMSDNAPRMVRWSNEDSNNSFEHTGDPAAQGGRVKNGGM